MKTLYLNGPIYTMESPRPVSALLVKDGTIAALGPDALFAVGAKTSRAAPCCRPFWTPTVT